MNAVVIDCLASPGPFNVPDRIGRPLTPEMMANAQASGITAVNLTVSGVVSAHLEFDAAFDHIAYWERELSTHPDALVKVLNVEDVRRAKETERLGLIYGFQDTTMLEDQVDRLDLFYERGVRVVQLTYNVRNEVGDGCLEQANAGLSEFGRVVVEQMNELGMLVDLSHCGKRTTAEAIEGSTVPVAITHSGCGAVFEHPRNKRDEELRKMADRGGVIGIYMMPFLSAEGPAQAEHFVEHVEHAIEVCGEDHVGVGSDNSITATVADDAYVRALSVLAEERIRLGNAAPGENEVMFVEGLNTPQRMELVAGLLESRGHSDRQVEKIVGGNFLRLFREVWK